MHLGPSVAVLVARIRRKGNRKGVLQGEIEIVGSEQIGLHSRQF